MDYSTVNIILDFVLIAASIWMIFVVRGVGGLVGRTLTFVVIGTVILGAAHLIATFGTSVLKLDGGLNNFIHRLVVLGGFLFLVFGFRQISAMKR